VVLADMLVGSSKVPLPQGISKSNTVIAHFNHGIRANSARDAEFVCELAQKYGVEFVLGEGKLGPNASEELARKKRYEFLRNVIARRGEDSTKQSRLKESTAPITDGRATVHYQHLGAVASEIDAGQARMTTYAGPSTKSEESGAVDLREKTQSGSPRRYAPRDDNKIITAHHQDDLIETIFINLIRGTGWRGLASFSSDDIERPLLNISKAEIIAYAIKNNLQWVEDETNYSPKYFRNRVRDLTARMTAAQRQQLLELYEKQKVLRAEIESMLDLSLRGQSPKQSSAGGLEPESGIGTNKSGSPRYARDDIIKLPDEVAIEVLNKITDDKLTRPQLMRLLSFLKTAKSGDICQPGGNLQIGIYRDSVSVTLINRLTN